MREYDRESLRASRDRAVTTNALPQASGSQAPLSH